MRLLKENMLANMTITAGLLQRLQDCIPISHDGKLLISVERALHDGVSSPRHEFFKLIVCLLSNNHDLSWMEKLILEAVQCGHNKKILNNLLRQNNATIRSFAEKLFLMSIYAIEKGLLLHLTRLVPEINVCSGDKLMANSILRDGHPQSWFRAWKNDVARNDLKRFIELSGCNKNPTLHYCNADLISTTRHQALVYCFKHRNHLVPLRADYGFQWFNFTGRGSNFIFGIEVWNSRLSGPHDGKTVPTIYLFKINKERNSDLVRGHKQECAIRLRGAVEYWAFCKLLLRRCSSFPSLVSLISLPRIILEVYFTVVPSYPETTYSRIDNMREIVGGLATNTNLETINDNTLATAFSRGRDYMVNLICNNEIYFAAAWDYALQSDNGRMLDSLLFFEGSSSNLSALEYGRKCGSMDSLMTIQDCSSQPGSSNSLSNRPSTFNTAHSSSARACRLTPSRVRLTFRKAISDGHVMIVKTLAKYIVRHAMASTNESAYIKEWFGIFDALAFIDPSSKTAFKISKLLVQAGADMGCDPMCRPIHRYNSTLLCNLILCGNDKVVKFLISEGMNPNLSAESRHALLASHSKCESAKPITALHAAGKRGSVELIRLLLGAGAEVNDEATNSLFESPLQFAVQGRHESAVRMLLEAGANINNAAAWRNGATALQRAVQNRDSVMTRMLLEAGADVNSEPAPLRGFTALQIAASQGNFSLASMLLEAGADVNAKRALIGGYTALEGAALYGRLDMARYLLNSGADITGQRNAQYHHAIGYAIAFGHMALAGYLQKCKSDGGAQERWTTYAITYVTANFLQIETGKLTQRVAFNCAFLVYDYPDDHWRSMRELLRG